MLCGPRTMVTKTAALTGKSVECTRVLNCSLSVFLVSSSHSVTFRIAVFVLKFYDVKGKAYACAYVHKLAHALTNNKDTRTRACALALP